ncbi:SMR domain-containing protein At5g58720 isoform X2 [Brachypodium distachyon]|uniref:Smr domain-containing protein n=1 Tax=Brachypodium distachyon TaxID=15368 RepID=A0A2K2D7D2_BRADI|nr:SMR domain-containing protein At5g58720 isoform X2 [Brachypodium distachyon]PNT70189.1 hypothetical protein BRADI_2g07430v3 [Brachypodium distachyon]PNT70190.1 hypothetical protein BRADI_2g07430v3 [Brachypodium distachyon]|eukprot:XP_014754799.1 SMR domain-containing protein At5g58720 isoform X2 [Brachypodium distachyon]
MKPSKKKSKKKKSPSPAATEGAAPTPPAADSSPGVSYSPVSETLTLAAAAAAVAASETESSGSSGGEASAYTRAFTSSSSGTASTSSLYAPSSSDSAASSSATGDERQDLAWLLEAFGSASIDQVESAYREAGCDPFLAAGILSSSQELQPPQPPPPPDLSPCAGSAGRKAARRPRKLAVAASGMVADVIGKGYSRPATPPVTATNGWKDRDGGAVSNAWTCDRNRERDSGSGDRKYNAEEAEQFLCSMLGDNSELSMGVVRDVLGQYGYDVEMALDTLLDISGMGWCNPNAEKNSIHSSNVYQGNGLSEETFTGSIKQSPHQFPEEIPGTTYHHSEKQHEFFWGVHQGSYMKAVCEVQHLAASPSRPTVVNSKMPQQVLESLFKVPEQRTYEHEPSKMDWKKVVKKLQSYNHPVTANNQERQKNGDGYQEFRGVAARHYDEMKGYYQKAALAYSKGDKSYASYLAEEGKHYRELGRKEDEKASREIFEARNKHITNTVTIDLHGQHVKQAMKLLKVHMLACVCMPSTLLRVITGCGGEGTGKGKIKRAHVVGCCTFKSFPYLVFCL